MSSSPIARKSDFEIAEDSGLKSVLSSFEERIPSQSGTPSVEFVKTERPRGSDGSMTPSGSGDENTCPNVETMLLKAEGSRISETRVAIPEPSPSSAEVNTQVCGDGAANCTFNDVSMMSVDGHMSVDFGPQENHSMPSQASEESLDPPAKGNSTFRRSGPPEGSRVPASSSEREDPAQTPSFTHRGYSFGTPNNRSVRRSARGSSICEEDDLFLTPTQDSAEESSHKKPISSLEASDDKVPLNGTFDKEASIVEEKANRTFDREQSLLEAGNHSVAQSSCKSPDFDLRLDSTCHPEESKIGSSQLPLEHMSTPVRKETRGSFTYQGIGVKDCEAIQNQENTSEQKLEDTEDPPAKERRSSSFMKRPCSILELSFVSSPKRANFQVTTPKATEKSCRSSLINFNESIAFDFSAAAKSAESNGGVAEMGSFVFASSSGLPVAGSDDPFDLRTLEKANRLAASKDEKFTRVSFIAMFDPIKIQEGNEGASGEKEPVAAEQDRKSAIIASHRTSSVSSPLIRGLPTPVFARPKPVKLASKTVEVQTDPVAEESKSPAPPVQEEVEIEIGRLNCLLEEQTKALSTYEEVLKKLVEARQQKLGEPDEDSKLKCRLTEERARNERLEEAVKSMECSMHSTLKRMQEFRTANEDLRKVVEEQQAALVGTRTELEDGQRRWEEDVSLREEEKQRLESHLEESARVHEKAVSMLNLQLQAKDSEIESLNMQLSISRKEVDSLRSVVNSMKLQ